MKKIFLSMLMCAALICSYAQVMPAKYQEARGYYNRLAYSEAIPLLIEECIGKKNRFLEADIMLADCYRQTNQYVLAEGEYAIVCQDVRLKDDKQKLYYAQILQINKKYEQAALWYRKYLEKFPTDKRAQNQAVACDNIAQFNTGKNLYVTNLPFNTDGYDFGACIYNNVLYYTSTGGKQNDLKAKDINLWTGEHFMDLYTSRILQSDTASDMFTKAEILPKTVNTKYNEGPLCFNAAGTKVFFTRNYYNPEEGAKMKYSSDREANLNIYEADVVGANWEKIRKLPFNSKEYSCGHPAWDETDSTLYFSSDMPGGVGGTDIWKVRYGSGKWGKPVNPGAVVNTEGDEMFPTFAPDKTFYFASDGHGGLGGLDIFSAKFAGNELSEVKNMGTPLNSSYDDFAYLVNDSKTVGFFSSDRPGGKGEDDIYRFADINYQLEVLVMNKFTKAPISSAHVLLKREEKLKADLKMDAKGLVVTPVDAGITYQLAADAPGFLPATISKTIEENEKKPLQKVTVELQPMVLQVKVIDAASKAPIPGVNISFSSPCGNISKNNQTGESGTVHYSVQENCTYSILATTKSYLPKPATQMTTTLKDTAFVLIELVQITEKAITLNNIYYDFDKWDIRPEAEADLSMLLTFMRDNPEAIVELSSHTDARGDDKYNQMLSQKRAQSAVNWLVARGVSETKIKPVGYGEKQPVNNCTNNVKCTEEEHQRNRRTEFKVLNAGEIINSRTKEKIEVDPCKNCLF